MPITNHALTLYRGTDEDAHHVGLITVLFGDRRTSLICTIA